MTASAISQAVCQRIDEADPANPISVSNAEVLYRINEGYLFASLLTLFLVKTVSFPLTGMTWYTPRQTIPDFLVPLKLTVNGIRLRPSTLTELDGWNSQWQATAGTPARYATLGSNLLAVSPQDPATMQLTYAASPVPLTAGDTPLLPPAYHQALIEWGVYSARRKEGGQQLARGLMNLHVYLDAMQQLGDWVRNRSKAAAYDVLSPEMAALDRSKLIDDIIKRQARRNLAGVAK